MSAEESEIVHAGAALVHRLLPYPRLIEALRTAHAEKAMPQLDTRISEVPSGDRFINLTAWLPSQAIAVKLVGVFPNNVARSPPEPSVQGLVVLFDGNTGRALMTCDGAALTYRKTASDSALGADYLARRDARTLLMIGAGGLGPHLIEAHRAARPTIERVLIWNRDPLKAARLATDLSREGIEADAAPFLDEALPEADIVSAATMATEPLIRGELLKPGCHVDLVGSYLPDMREADDAVFRRSGLVSMDTWEGWERTGDIAQPMARGLIRDADRGTDLFGLASGQCRGREDDGQITIFKNIGGGHLDLFTALELHRALLDLSN